jgi:competence protein ComEA
VSERPILGYAVLLGIVAVVGFLALRGRSEPPPAAPQIALSRESPRAGARLTVHVAGAVRAPGVFRLRPGSRVDDAVRRAGGPTRRADLTAVNLAAPLEDGRQVLVPERPRGVRPGAVVNPADAPVNLNTATLEQLDGLDGIGPGMGQRIIDYREENGGFGSVEELSQVPGIGEKRMAALREDVTV